MRLSVIIPTLNEEVALPGTLGSVVVGCPNAEIVIVDGGSSDGTRGVYEAFVATARQPVLWVNSERGRGRQMNAGAQAATGDVLLFLHADTHLPPNAERRITFVVTEGQVYGGNFRIAFEPRSRLSDFYAICYNLRSYLRVFYGDSALFVRREIFEALGGYKADRIMEDVEFIGRLRRVGNSDGEVVLCACARLFRLRPRLAYLSDATVVTSSRRFHGTKRGLRMLLVWTLLHTLMAFGVSQETLERLYPTAR